MVVWKEREQNGSPMSRKKSNLEREEAERTVISRNDIFTIFY